MSCDGNRAVYFAHICAHAGAGGGGGVTPADLETLYERNIGPPQGEAEALLNDAKTRSLFADMRKLAITPPTHSESGLPKVASRRGYAAIYDEVRRRGRLRDAPSAPVTGDTGDILADAGIATSASVTGDTGVILADAGIATSAPVTGDTGGMRVTAGAAATPAAPAPAAAPRLVAVQGTPGGKIDSVAFRVNGGPPRYVWGGSWQAMKDAVKAIPSRELTTKRPWFNRMSKVWELSGTEAEVNAALAAQGWQIATAPPDPSSVIRAGAAIITANGAEIHAATPPMRAMVPVHRANGTVAWVPDGSPAPPSPATKAATKAEQEAQIVAQARELLNAAPRLIDGANGEATLDAESPVSAQLQRWAESARSRGTGDVYDRVKEGDIYRHHALIVGLRYYAQAACLAAGIPPCPTCGQFLARDGSHVCPHNRYDAAGYNPAGYNRRGYDRDGFNAQGRDAEGYDRSGLRVAPGTTVQVNRRGLTQAGVRPDGTHPSGHFLGFRTGYSFSGYDGRGYDREGYDRDGYHQVTQRDRGGYDRRGLDAAGNHLAGTPDADGLYADGLDAEGYDREGYAPDRYDRWGFSREGFHAVDANGVRVPLSKDGRDRQGMRYVFHGCDRHGCLPNGRYPWGANQDGELRTIRSPKTGKLIRATYDADGIDPTGINRQGFSVRDGLSEPDEDGRRVAANGWVYDPATRDLCDPDDPSRRMPHQWKTTKLRIGRVWVTQVISTGTPPPVTPLGDGRMPPSEEMCRALGRPLTGAWRDAPAPLASPSRIDYLRATRDPQATRTGIRLRCPACAQFTGGKPHACPAFTAQAKADPPMHVGRTVVVSASGVVIDARGISADLTGMRHHPAETPAALILVSPAVPDYDPAYRVEGYNRHGYDPDGYTVFGYNARGLTRTGYTREGYDVLGFDADGYDRSGYNRQGKDRSGKERPLTVEELRRSLPPGEEPMATEEMARHYSRLAQAITNKPVVVTFDTSIPTGATDMRGNIFLNPHPLGKDAAPARNMLVVKAIMYHEVGHELTTNGDHWAELKGIAASPVPVEGIDKGRAHILKFYNIIEDGRMERDVSDRFPGVAGALAAAARLRDKWDFAVGKGIPPLYQVTGALLYTTLPYYRVPHEVVEKMTPDARALYEELRPIALQGALGSPEDALAATKEIVRRLERAGAFETESPAQKNIEITPPGGAVGNKAPTPPKPAPPPPAGGEGGEGEGEGEPNGRGKGWRKGQKTAPDEEPSERQNDGDEDESGAPGGSPGGEDAEGDEDGAGGSPGDEDADSQGGGAGGSPGDEDADSQGGGAGGSPGDEDAEGEEGGQGGADGSQGGEDDGEEGGQDGADGSPGGEDADGEEGGQGGAGGSPGGEDAEGEEGGQGGEAGGSPGDEDAEGEEGGQGGGTGGSQEGEDDGEEGRQGGSPGGQQRRSQGGETSEDGEGGDSPPRPPPPPESPRAPEMGDGDDTLGGDGSGGDAPAPPVAISGERFDPITPFTDADLDAALKAADREAAQVIAAQVRRQANYSVLGKRLHRRLNADRTANQAYRTADGRASSVEVVQPRSTDAAHIRTLTEHDPLHREVSGKLARQLETIRAQADTRMRFQTSGKLDQRRIVAAVRGADEVRVTVQEQPATSMAVSLTLDFSGSMNQHVTAGKVYNAASILGATFEQLEMPYEIRGHADKAAIFKAMDDEKRDPARMAMTAVVGNGCGEGNSETASTMGLATSSLMARDEQNKLIVSLMDGEMYDHDATVAQLAESRKGGVVTFGVFLGRPNPSQQQKLTQMFGAGSWVPIDDLGAMPQAMGRRLARIFESIGKK